MIQNKKIVITVFFVLFLVFGWFLLGKDNEVKYVTEWREDIILSFKEVKLRTEVADDSLSRKKGVAGRESIQADRAMLFIFDSEAMHGIWMKDVKFDIDIIWLDKEKKVVHIEEMISPKTFFEIPPKEFYPTVDSLYVVETKSGWVTDVGLETGDTISF